MITCICLWVSAQFYQVFKPSFHPVTVDSSLFAFWLIIESGYLNVLVFCPFPTQPPVQVCWLLTSGKPKEELWLCLEANVFSQVRQFSLTKGQSLVSEMLMDGALTLLGSTTNKKFQRGSNTKGDNLYTLFILTKNINNVSSNGIRPRNTVLRKVQVSILLLTQR